MASTYAACLFDFDYTLGDATEGIVASMNYAFGCLGLPAQDREAIRRTIGMHLSEAFTNLTGLMHPEQSVAFQQAFRTKADQVMTGSTVLFPDAIPVLKRIKAAGIMTGIVTTKFRYRIVELLEAQKITDLVDVIVGGEDVSSPKPDPEGLLLAIDRLGLPRNLVLYTGDSTIDAKAAIAAGVDFVAVTTGTTSREDFAPYPSILVAGSLAEGMAAFT